MRIRVLPVLLVLVLAGLLALFNWTAFTTPTELNLMFGTVYAPLGAVLLGALALVGALYIATVLYLQGTALLDARRLGRDLQSQRELADKAEASRFTELREFLHGELVRMGQADAQLREQLFARLDEAERRQRTVLEQSVNSLSAYIGELENRLEHRMLPASDVPLRERADHHRGMPPR